MDSNRGKGYGCTSFFFFKSLLLDMNSFFVLSFPLTRIRKHADMYTPCSPEPEIVL